LRCHNCFLTLKLVDNLGNIGAKKTLLFGLFRPMPASGAGIVYQMTIVAPEFSV